VTAEVGVAELAETARRAEAWPAVAPTASGFVPLQVAQVELTKPLRIVPVLAEAARRDHRRALVLVRVHGHPLGTVQVDLRGGSAPAARLARTIWDALAAPINEHLSGDGHVPLDALRPHGIDASGCRRPLRAPHPAPLISVVVPTCGRPTQLSRCLASLLALDYPAFEVVVIDNCPPDGSTRELVERLAAHDHRVRYFEEPRAGASRARNRGLAWVRGKIVAFTDDDVVVDRLWLAAIAARFDTDPTVACVTGLVLAARLDTAAQQWFEEYGGFNKGFTPRIFDQGDNRVRGAMYPYAPGVFGSGNNVAFRADVVRALGGYDVCLGPGTPTRAGEDLDLLLSVVTGGYRLAYEPAAIVHHEHRESHTELLNQLHGYGVGLSALLTGQALRSPRQLGAILRRVPRGAAAVLDPGSWKNTKRSSAFPPSLARAEMAGMIRGPFAYVRSRAGSRRRPRVRPSGGLLGRARAHLAPPLVHNAYALIATTVITSVLGFAYWALAARRYLPEEVGRSAAAISTMVLLSGIAQLNLMSGLTRFLPIAGSRTRVLVLTAYAATVGLATLVCIAFFAVTQKDLLGLDGPGWVGPAWFLLAVLAWGVFTLQDSVLTGLGKAVWIPVENGAFAVVKIVLLLALASRWQQGGIFASWTIPVAVSLLPVNVFIFRRLIPGRRRRAAAAAGPSLRRVVTFVANDYVGGLFQLAAMTLLPLLVAERAGLTSAGHFYAAWVVVLSFELVLSNLGTSLVVAGSRDEGRVAVAGRMAARLGLALVVPAAALAALFAPALLSLLGDGYASEASTLLRLLCVGVLFRAVVMLAISIARVRRRLRRIVAVQVSLCVGVLGISSALIGPLGLTGVGVGYLVTQLVVATAVAGSVVRELIGPRTRSPAPWRRPAAEVSP
jgi:GT2 family glycosyltransferase/O-antigen/teichoic acid export membrane protein